MLPQLQFYRAFSKNRFAEALALYSRFPDLRASRIKQPYLYYACYRLGMYRTVADTPLCRSRNWRGGFARVVSLAACGRNDEAQEQVEVWLEHKRSDAVQADLADCMAPFDPQLAWNILQHCTATPLLRGALAMRVGETIQAQACLNGLMQSDGEILPEARLYYANAFVLTGEERLSGLNRFLAAFDIAPLRLIDADKQPAPLNVEVDAELPSTGGPLVSVLMTAFNSVTRVGSAIQSVLQQTYRDIELIVVDDASSDATAEVVKRIATQDKRVRYLRMPRNVGTYVAKNIGLLHAKGEFVTCHDSDDWCHPLKIERQVAPMLENKEYVFTTSHWVRMQDDGVYYARPVHPLMRINPASPLFRRDLVLKYAGSWDVVRTGADSEFLARLKLVFGRKAMCRIAQPLTLGAHREDSLMTAKDTGYSAEGMSPTRLRYWEAWNRWHIEELCAGRLPCLRDPLARKRTFTAPQEIEVPVGDIAHCLKNVG